ncbi:MAG: PHP domain-containing protein [Anaerolineales bacterium]|nr:PHP domain-containing protein [Anaerolineales bacterium]MDW8162348.1 PHP domain-containing protein [Anaerolineales bacterium]
MPIRVELHCHTDASPDSLLNISQLLETCRRKRIDKIAITDHNTIRNALLAQRIAPRQIIIGEEILTRQGELLAFFVQEEIPPGLDAQHVIAELRKQGAFISVSHPFDPLRKGHWQKTELEKIIGEVDAIEVFNARCLSDRYNRQASAFAAQHKLLGTVGSDAHTAGEIGTAYHLMEDFETPEQFRAALQNSKKHTRLALPWVHLFSRYAQWKKSSRIA